jgi:thymidylate synthase
MKQYLDLLRHILDHGEIRTDRTGVGTISVFGYMTRFNLQEGFPAVTTKKLAWRAVVGELLWFLEGSTDERRLVELTYGKIREALRDVRTIWTDNADKQGVDLGYTNDDYEKELGPIYGYQWRNFGGTEDLRNAIRFGFRRDGFDQIEWLLDEIKNNPDSRRLILSAWEPNSIADMSLPPCHMMCQFSVRNNQLSCLLYIRSNDAMLGAPFNIASYALLTHIIARECGLGVGDLVYTIGDAHIYLNHINQVREQLGRNPKELPNLNISDDFCLRDHLYSEFPLDAINKFELIGYDPHPAIKAPMAV